jgi:hypothetical protein
MSGKPIELVLFVVSVVQLFFQSLSSPLPTIAKEAAQLVCQEFLYVPTTKVSFRIDGRISSYDEFGAGNMQGLAKAFVMVGSFSEVFFKGVLVMWVVSKLAIVAHA